MSVQRADILFGSADTARAPFNDGLNYFFISTYLDIRDPLICTPLFSPDTISEHFGVQWTNGTDVLLTWKGPGTELSAEWVETYRATLKGSPIRRVVSATALLSAILPPRSRRVVGKALGPR